MRTHVFLQKGTWLKCALHAHTTNSDGELAPTDLVRHYEQAGFDALVITDHWIRTVEPSTERLLVVPGTELDALRGDGKTYAHVLALGVAFGLLWIAYADVAYTKHPIGKLILFCVAGALTVLWAIVPRPDRFEPPGPRIEPQDQPDLFKVRDGFRGRGHVGV